MKFALDIGHGLGNKTPGLYDPGAVGSGYQEHIIVAGMVARQRANLMALGHQVITTSGLLGTRDDTAKKWGADLLVSFHCNSHTSIATGTECWVDTRASARGRAVAQEITHRLSKSIGIPNRGVKVTNFSILSANPNDCLIEMFFINNPADLQKYQANVNSHELAILNGILTGCGLKPVSVLPRIKTSAPTQPAIQYVKIVIHADKIDTADYMRLANAKNDFIDVSDTTKDSWKTW